MSHSQAKSVEARAKQKAGALPRSTLIWLGAIAFTGMTVALVYSMIRQDSLEQQVFELRYRLETVERRPTRLSESDRVSIQHSTQEQLDEAIQSLKR